MNKKHQMVVLLIGIFLCAACALFPPRRITNTSGTQFIHTQGELTAIEATHDFLFASDFGVYHGPNSWVFPAEVDGGCLLAELVLIGAITAGVILVPSLFGETKHDA